MGRIAIIAVAIGAALAPIPAAAVERLYSAALYLTLQRAVTAISNLLPFALFDALLVSAAASWVWLLVRDVARSRGGWTSIVGRALRRTVTAAAALYLVFLATWGLNYQRIPLADKLDFDAGSVSVAAARTLAITAVAEVNRLHGSAHRVASAEVDPTLAGAFELAQAELGVSPPARPARPKRSILDLYFKRAAVDGMTNPYFLETLVVSDLLPFERSFVVAHEWSHLAGFADEGEANFLGWLTCIRGSPAAQYSAWLFLYREAIGAVRMDDRRTVAGELAAGPQEDLRAIAERIQQHVNPALAAAGWQVYDRYLKANRVEAGTASYAEVVRLVLGTNFSPSWVPVMRARLPR